VAREPDALGEGRKAAPERARFSLAARAQSFAHAGRGVVTLLASQHNARIHAALTLAVLALGLALGVSRLEWACLALAMGLVWAAEALNSALEDLCDVASPEYHPRVRQAKDVAAAGVLCAALAAAAVGLLVLGPPLVSALSSLF
jgi:diacylglycerol kinase (ATP)